MSTTEDDTIEAKKCLMFKGLPEHLIGISGYRGLYDNGKSYNKNDIVTDVNKQVYICLTGIQTGEEGIPLTNATKWLQISYNDTSFKFKCYRVDGPAVSSNGYAGGRQQYITLPQVFQVGDIIHIRAIMNHIGGATESTWAIYVEGQRVSGIVSGNGGPMKIKGYVIKRGSIGTGAPDLIGYASGSTTERSTISNINTSGVVEVSLVKLSGGTWQCEYFSAEVAKSTPTV